MTDDEWNDGWEEDRDDEYDGDEDSDMGQDDDPDDFDWDDFDPNPDDDESDDWGDFDPNPEEDELDDWDDFDPNPDEDELDDWDDFDPNPDDDDDDGEWDDFDPNTDDDQDDWNEFDPNTGNEAELEDELRDIENMGSQSTVQVRDEQDMQAEKSEEEVRDDENIDDSEDISPDAEEYEQFDDPITNVEEAEFIRDMQDLSETLNPGSEVDTAYNAEQAYEKMHDSKKEVESTPNENEEEEDLAEKEFHEEETKMDESSEDDKEEEVEDELPEELRDQEELDFLMDKFEESLNEGLSPEEISEIMQEAENVYEELHDIERNEVESELPDDDSDEEEAEDYKEEIVNEHQVQELTDEVDELGKEGLSPDDIARELEKEEQRGNLEKKVQELAEREEQESLKDIDHWDEEEDQDYKEEVTNEYQADGVTSEVEEMSKKGMSTEEIEQELEEREKLNEIEKQVSEMVDREVQESIKNVEHWDEEEDGDYKEEITNEYQAEEVASEVEEMSKEGMSPEDIERELEKEEQFDQFEKQVREFAERDAHESLKIVEHCDEEEEDDYLEDIVNEAIASSILENVDEQMDEEPSPGENKVISEKEEILVEFAEVSQHKEECEDHKQNPEVTEQIQESVEHKENGSVKDYKKQNHAVTDSELEQISPEQMNENETKSGEHQDSTQVDDLEELKQEYREKTGKRPVYAKKLTRDFQQWLKTILKTREKEKQEEKLEDWQEFLLKWIEDCPEEEMSSELKEILKEIIINIDAFEKLKQSLEEFLNFNARIIKEGLSEKDQERLLPILRILTKVNPIQQSLYENLKNFREFFNQHYVWNPQRINHIKDLFIKHLIAKYQRFYLQKGTFKNKEDEIGNKKNTYTAVEFIEDLRSEIQKLAEILANIFEDRVERYSDRDLSRFWRGSNHQYISKVISRIKNPNLKAYNPNFTFPADGLKKLERKLRETLGIKALGSLRILEEYRKALFSTLEFIEKLKSELGRVSGDVNLTNEELSILLGSDKDFIHRVFDTINNRDSKRWYNPAYKFTRERLEIFEETLNRLFYHHSVPITAKIKEYVKLNPDLIYYHNKDYNIENEDFFNSIDNEEKGYWFGFLLADGNLGKKRPRIKFELSSKDRDRIVAFCQTLGIDVNRIEDYTKLWRYKGKLRSSEMSRIEFSSKKVKNSLMRYEFIKFKLLKTGIPSAIKKLIKSAKIEAKQQSISFMTTRSGRIVCAWLLGLYDGDGTYVGGNQGRLYSSNIQLLNEIKECFEIKNIVFPQGTGNAINLGPEVFSSMIRSYKDSMARKRPYHERNK